MKYTVYDPPVMFLREPEPVGAYDAKTRLGELLDGVEGGASYVITRHGKPVARLLPMEPGAEADRVVDALLAARAGRRLGAPVRSLIEEGRR
jgi:prevent-host-death family protein